MSLRRLRAAMHPNHDAPDRRPDVTRPPAKSRQRLGRATKCRRKPHQEVDVNLSKRLGVAEGAQPAYSGESRRRIGWVWGYLACAPAGPRTPMTSVSQELPTGEHTAGGFQASPYGWIVRSLVLVLMAVSGWRDGGFWRSEAAAIAVIAAILLVAAVVMSPPDRRSLFAIASFGLVALWWYIRTATADAGRISCPSAPASSHLPRRSLLPVPSLDVGASRRRWPWRVWARRVRWSASPD